MSEGKIVTPSNPTNRELAESLVHQVIGRVCLTCETIFDKPEDWERAYSYVVDALTEAEKRGFERGVREAADRVMADCPCSAQSGMVCEHRFIEQKLLSLLKEPKETNK